MAKALEYHPSYGYATRAQIEELRNTPAGPKHDLIMKEIQKQTEAHGKKKKGRWR